MIWILERKTAFGPRRADALQRLRHRRALFARLVGPRAQSAPCAAPQLATRVEAGLAALALDGSRIVVEIADTDDAPGAGEAVQLLLSTNPGVEPGPSDAVLAINEDNPVTPDGRGATGSS